jgi:hypothetical protein
MRVSGQPLIPGCQAKLRSPLKIYRTDHGTTGSRIIILYSGTIPRRRLVKKSRLPADFTFHRRVRAFVVKLE